MGTYLFRVYPGEVPVGMRQVINPVEAVGRTGWLLVSVLALVRVESTLQSSGSEPPSQNMGRPPLRSKSPLLSQRATKTKTKLSRQPSPKTVLHSDGVHGWWNKVKFIWSGSLPHDALIVTTDCGALCQIAIERTCFRDSGGHFECIRTALLYEGRKWGSSFQDW